MRARCASATGGRLASRCRLAPRLFHRPRAIQDSTTDALVGRLRARGARPSTRSLLTARCWGAGWAGPGHGSCCCARWSRALIRVPRRARPSERCHRPGHRYAQCALEPAVDPGVDPGPPRAPRDRPHAASATPAETARERRKPRNSGAFEPSAVVLSPPPSADSGGGIRTRDLRVMSPTSYQTAPPRGGNSSLATSRETGQDGRAVDSGRDASGTGPTMAHRAP